MSLEFLKNVSFYLVSFKGRHVLFDKEEKKYHHIDNWTTAVNLSFARKAERVETDFSKWEKGEEIKILEETITISSSDYTAGKIINTQLS